jgi:hypothetical protein
MRSFTADAPVPTLAIMCSSQGRRLTVRYFCESGSLRQLVNLSYGCAPYDYVVTTLGHNRHRGMYQPHSSSMTCSPGCCTTDLRPTRCDSRRVAGHMDGTTTLAAVGGSFALHTSMGTGAILSANVEPPAFVKFLTAPYEAQRKSVSAYSVAKECAPCHGQSLTREDRARR